MPAYNAGPWIAAAMQSVLQQTMSDLELIVIDDGSTDDTRTRIRAVHDRRLVLLEGPHRGAAAARNLGLATARGQFLQHLDADDLLARDKLEQQVTRLQEAAGDCVASGRWVRFYGAEPNGEQGVRDVLWQDMEPVSWLQQALSEQSMMHPAAWLVPRKLLDRVGNWNECLSLNDDGEFFARVVEQSRRILFVDPATSWYRSGLPSSLSASQDWRSACIALDGIVRCLLNLRNDQTSRQAAAKAWARLAIETHPVDRHCAVLAYRRAKELDSAITFHLGGGTVSRLAQRVLGWRWARTLQYWSRRR
jgi:glycosyltransferase involved in cell wall biosynthesis